MTPPTKKTTPPPNGLRIFLIIVLLMVGWLAFFTLAFPENVKEYRLYLTEARPPIAFGFDELSQEWSEADLRTYFKDIRFTCSQNEAQGNPKERICFADVSAHNSTPAMFLSFFFVDGQLDRVAINIPWWAHQTAYKTTVAQFGPPVASQFLPVDGIRLHGWKLANGSALFLNRDRPFNPLEWNSILWQSARACTQSGCFVQ